MDGQVRVLDEAFAAFSAGVWLLFGVSPTVRHQVGAPAEALATLRTGVGLLSRVGADMVVIVRHLDEALAAVGTGVGLFPGVNPLVADEGGFAWTAFPAVAADEQGAFVWFL